MTTPAPKFPSRFVQIHLFFQHGAVLLNRDDAGQAKRMPYGSAVRGRVSSQCFKRHLRRFDGEDSIASLGEGSVRSRETFEQLVVRPLLAQGGFDEPTLREVAAAVRDLTLGAKEKPAAAEAEEATEGAEEAKPKKRKGRKAEAAGEEAAADDGAAEEPEAPMPPVHTEQVVVLGRPEIDYLRGLVAQIATEAAPDVAKARAAAKGDPKAVAKAAVKSALDRGGKANLQALAIGAGLDAALFGRMVTSDVLTACDAAVQVNHMLTVDALGSENDYFTAVDDLPAADGSRRSGSAHLGSAELTSGLFYSFLVVDVPQLVSNLTGLAPWEWRQADRSLAAAAVRNLILTAATVTCGAKLGSTAPYSYASFVLAQVGTKQPCNLMPAFLRPVEGTRDHSVLEVAYGRLAAYIAEIDAMYGAPNPRRSWAAVGAGSFEGALADVFGCPKAPLADVANWAAARVEE